MITRLIPRRSFLRILHFWRTSQLVYSTRKTKNIPKVFLIAAAPYSLFDDIDNARDNMENFDLKLKEACERGEAAIVELMDLLKKNLTTMSGAYKDCLQKQIKLIDEATKAGSASSKWDELPEIRTMAADLNQQFQNFVATINTLGQIAQSETLKYITQQEKQFKLLAKKHKELEAVITKQLQEIKKLEQKLLDKNRDSIEKTR